MTKNQKRAAVVLLSPVLFAGSAVAQIGWQMTFDPTACARIFSETMKIVDQTEKVVAVGRNTEATFNTLKSDGEVIKNRGFFKGFFVSAMNNAMTPNQSGVTGGWMGSVNKNLNTANTWATTAMGAYYNPRLLQRDRAAQVKAANAEIGRGAAVTGMSTLGQARIAQGQMQAPIAACEQKAVSPIASDNTRGALQTISAGCASLQLRQSQTQLAIESSRLELDIARMKQAVDTQNEHLAMWSGVATINESQPTGLRFSSHDLQAYRLP